MRYLMRLNVLKGSGKRAEVPGFLVGGKTGTAEKVINGRYSNANASTLSCHLSRHRSAICGPGHHRRAETGKGQTLCNGGHERCPTVAEIVAAPLRFSAVEPDFRVRDTAILSSYRR